MCNSAPFYDRKVTGKLEDNLAEFDTYQLGRLRSLSAHHMTCGGRLQTT